MLGFISMDSFVFIFKKKVEVGLYNFVIEDRVYGGRINIKLMLKM